MTTPLSRFGEIRHDWTDAEVLSLFDMPFNDLLFHAHTVHREYFDPNAVQISTLLSIKTGACPEDCAYCPQSIRFNTGLETEELMDVDEVLSHARAAKAQGATRFCMGAAYRNPKDKQLAKILDMVKAVHEEGLETCATLGMLTEEQSRALKDAGLDYYNHNLDTSADYYEKIITTRTYQDRLDTLKNVREAGLKVCCGGIIGMGENKHDRVQLIATLGSLPEHPGSVPINLLIQVKGTPLYGTKELDPVDFVRTIAVARLVMPASHVRLSAGRNEMSDETQALCFFAGANSIFYGDTLLTTDNPNIESDRSLFERLGLHPEPPGNQDTA